MTVTREYECTRGENIKKFLNIFDLLHGKFDFTCMQSGWKALFYGYACS